MFTWIQRYFQRHFVIIFALILAAMAIPLVVVFAPSSGIGQGDHKVATRDVFGYNLGSQEDQARLFGDANLSATMQLGYAGISGEQLQAYALQRAAALQLANEWHIPASTKDEVADYIKTLRAFSTPEGSFDAKRYAGFVESLKSGSQIKQADVSRIFGDDVRAEKVRGILSGPGYVLDADVESQLKRIATTWNLDVATIAYDSYKPAINPTSDQLAKFFGENSFRYEISPRVSATYVSYPSSAYSSQITVTEDELRALFEADPARFTKPSADGKSTTAATTADFVLVRSQVESALRLTKAQRLATKAASDLSLAIYESKLSNDPTVLASFFAANRVKELPLQPFTQTDGPAELGGSAQVANAAFKLNAERFYSDAIPVNDGAVVLFWKDTLPARTPLLSEVQTKVTADYIDNEKRKQFVELGRRLKASLEAKLKAGETFAEAAKAVASANAVQITVKDVKPFSLSNPPGDDEFTQFNVLENLSQGGVSDMVITRESGVLVHAAGKQLPDLTPTNPQYVQTRQQIAAYTARMSVNTLLGEMVTKELAKSEPKLD
jgi:peptidyl-prolyl cis-trans isomerase D